MKLYTYVTPAHVPLRDKWFLPSLRDAFDINSLEIPQECATAEFLAEGWKKTTRRKVDLLTRATAENMGGYFVFSDVDVQFFRPVEPLLTEALKDVDIVIQRDAPWGTLCSGFFACRASDATRRLWSDMTRLFDEGAEGSDQAFLNRLLMSERVKKGNRPPREPSFRDPLSLFAKRFLSRNIYGIRWAYLPPSFFGGGTLTGRLWNPGDTLPVPRDIVMHHANWTVGLENKIAQLEHVRRIVDGRTPR